MRLYIEIVTDQLKGSQQESVTSSKPRSKYLLLILPLPDRS